MNLKKIVMLGIVGMASAAAGIAIPQMMSGHVQTTPETPAADAGHGADGGHAKKETKSSTKAADHSTSGHGTSGHGTSSGHGADAHGKGTENAKPRHDGPSFVPFGRTVTNLNDPKLIKFLSLEITLQVDGDDEEEVKSAVESRKPILQTWLTSQLADKTVEDIRGKVGVNRLRREIQDNFNALLFSDGRERIRDILFEEFHVQ